MNNEFIGYLNSLHNAGANNENAIAEVSIGSKYFDKMLVKRPVDEFVRKLFLEQEPSFTIITGHAGDGKTSMLIQLLKSCDYQSTKISSNDEFKYEGKKMFFIKDFSEFSDDERSSLFRECEKKVTQGIHVVLIANTGPLINTITKRFSKEVASTFLTLIQDGKGNQEIIEGTPFHVINIAKLENHDFIKPYIEKIINKEHYETCESCENREVCPIYFNRNLMLDNRQNFISFLEDHFIWQNEHGTRSTIRQIIALISYSITGGLYCSSINASLDNEFKFKHLISNNLFGYFGCKPKDEIIELQSIKDLALREYDGKQLPCDEAFHLKRDFKALDKKLQNLVTHDFYEKMISPDKIHDFQKALRRMYILFNIETNEDTLLAVRKVLFSNNFPEFVKLKYSNVTGNNKVKGEIKNVIIKGIASLFLEGKNAANKNIIVTLKRESSIEQVVQIELGSIPTDSLLLEKSKINQFSSNLERYEILLRSADDIIHTSIGLPLINYFEQLQSGLLSSNIDPHLSHGIGALKAQITTFASKKDDDEDQITFQSLSIKGWDSKKLEKINNKWVLS